MDDDYDDNKEKPNESAKVSTKEMKNHNFFVSDSVCITFRGQNITEMKSMLHGAMKVGLSH